MYKPNSLRQHLSAASPDLRRDPDKLLVFADEGRLIATGTAARSFEYAYKLNVIITDYGGNEDALMVPLLDWIAHHQPDLLNHPDKRERGIRFLVDFNNHNSVDISLEIELTERVIVRQDNSKLNIQHASEPLPAPDYSAPYWQLYKGDTLLAEWALLGPSDNLATP
jgi:hypothetical protein